MRISRRQFVHSSSGAAALAAAATTSLGAAGQRPDLPAPVRALEPYPGKATPIADAERLARIEKARQLMAENGMRAIVLEPGTSMSYYVNVRWGLSERPFLVIIPAKGELAYVAPAFEEQRAREITRFTNDIRVWQETRTGGRSWRAS